jgi:hypothetical protein
MTDGAMCVDGEQRCGAGLANGSAAVQSWGSAGWALMAVGARQGEGTGGRAGVTSTGDHVEGRLRRPLSPARAAVKSPAARVLAGLGNKLT